MKKLFTVLIFTILILSSLNNRSSAQVTYTESFDSATFPPTGWTATIATGSVNWARYTGTQYPSGYLPHSGAGMAGYDCYDAFPPANALLISPAFSLSGRGSNTDSVVFWYFRGTTYAGDYDSLNVWINTSASLTGATYLGGYPVIGPPTNDIWYRYAFYLPSSFNGATNYIIFNAVSEYWNDIFIDDVSFTEYPLSAPQAPVLTYPPNGWVDLTLTDTLTWNASTGATSYHVQLATDTGFTNLVVNDSTPTTTTRIVSGLNPLTFYYWRVNAKNAAGTSAYSSRFSFKTKGSGTAPTLYQPANNSTNQATSVICVWSKAVDQTFGKIRRGPSLLNSQTVSNYWFELYTDTTIAPVIRDSSLSPATDTSRSVTGLLNNQNYWWRVKSKNDVGWGPFSSYFKFTTIVAAPPIPTLLRPANNSVDIPPTTWLVWTTATGATSYRVQCSTDSTFATSVLDSTVNIDSLQVPAGRLAYNTKYYWHVRASNVGGNSNYTPLFNFTTSLVGIVGNSNIIPKVFKLYENYPNPFNPTTDIKFDIPNSADVKIVMYNTLGQQSAVLVDGHYAAGSYSVQWNASNYPSGVYFYRITAGSFTDVKKMVLLK